MDAEQDRTPAPSPAPASPGLGPVGGMVVAGLGIAGVTSLVIPVIGPMMGLLLCGFAMRRAALVPTVDSRALARWGLIVAGLALLPGVILSYMQFAGGSAIGDVLNAIARRDAAGVLSALPADADRPAEAELQALLDELVPAGQEGAPKETKPVFQTMRYELPFPERTVMVDLDIDITDPNSRSGFKLQGVRVEPKPAEPAPAPAPAPGEDETDEPR